MSATPILVTGGAGYIGSHTCKALAAAGYLPITVDNLARGHRDAVKWGPFEHADITDRASLDRILKKWHPAAILHFAGLAYVGESVTDPGLYWRVNVVGAFTLIEAARDAGIDKLVFSSTCATYGIPEVLPITETTPQNPINPYGYTKLAVERLLADMDVAHGLRSISLRYFNAAGADPEGEIGWDHDPDTRIVPLAVKAALGVGPALSVLGTDYPTPDGTCVRDYIHVSDLASAHVQALKALEAGAKTQRLNLGTGRGISIRELIDAVEKVLERKVPVITSPRRPGDPPTLVADASAAQAALNWRPVRSDLDSIIADAASWVRRHHNR